MMKIRHHDRFNTPYEAVPGLPRTEMYMGTREAEYHHRIGIKLDGERYDIVKKIIDGGISRLIDAEPKSVHPIHWNTRYDTFDGNYYLEMVVYHIRMPKFFEAKSAIDSIMEEVCNASGVKYSKPGTI